MLHFLRANARWLAAGFLLTMFSSFGQTFFIGLSGNEIRARFDLSGGEFGMIYMIATLGSAAVLPWVGRSLDVMPGWKVARFVLPCLAFACALMALAPHIAVLVLAVRLLPYPLIPLAVASAALALLGEVWGFYLFMLLFGVSYGFTSTLFGALWPEAYGVAHLGSIRARPGNRDGERA